MSVLEALHKRKSYRKLIHAEIGDDIIESLAEAAQLAPSCFNNQPWRYIFVKDEAVLEEMKSVYSDGNEWCHDASMVVAVFSKKEDDCVIHDREYYLFDTGLSAGFLMLRATELGLVAHAIAGYSPRKVRKLLEIPEEYNVIALICVGKKADLSGDPEEETRAPRKDFEEFVFIDRYVPND